MRKMALAFTIFLIAPIGASAQQQKQPQPPIPKEIVINLHWITDSNGCKIWDSKPSPNETVTWTGTCTDGYADGKGKLIWIVNGHPSGTYEGEMKGGHYDGQGTQIWPTGSRYDGEWRNDRAEGHGTYRSAQGDVCTGLWANGCLAGCLHSIGVSECDPTPAPRQ
jgi:hypothetical protein